LDDDKIEFLLGLDTLLRHRCILNLSRKVLEFPDAKIEVPFLSEGQIKRPFMAGEGSSPPRASPSKPQGGASPVPKQEDIDTLVRLGYSKEKAIKALSMSGGNVEYAANLLFQGTI
jgi:hypothetical protein